MHSRFTRRGYQRQSNRLGIKAPHQKRFWYWGDAVDMDHIWQCFGSVLSSVLGTCSPWCLGDHALLVMESTPSAYQACAL